MRKKRALISTISPVVMKRLVITVGLLLTWLVCQPSYAGTGLLFDIRATGAASSVNITLCLNGKGALSCQNVTLSALNLQITTTTPTHVYPFAGIKINTPGYTLANLGVDCTPANNGYCLFSVSSSSSKTLTLFPPIGSTYAGGVVACLKGAPYRNLIAAINDSVNGIPWPVSLWINLAFWANPDSKS